MLCLHGEEAAKPPTENDVAIKDSLTTVAGAQDAVGYAGQRVGNYVRDSNGNWWTSYIDEDGNIHISNVGVPVAEGGLDSNSCISGGPAFIPESSTASSIDSSTDSSMPAVNKRSRLESNAPSVDGTVANLSDFEDDD